MALCDSRGVHGIHMYQKMSGGYSGSSITCIIKNPTELTNHIW